MNLGYATETRVVKTETLFAATEENLQKYRRGTGDARWMREVVALYKFCPQKEGVSELAGALVKCETLCDCLFCLI